MDATTTLRVESAAAADLAAIRTLLVEARLPVDDLGDLPDLRFRVVRDGERLAGTIGLERYGDVGLLRSLVVAPDRRRSGAGTALVRALERDARSAGIVELVLLTQTAESFFRRLGYAAIERADAPDAVKASAEFRHLCPASAVCMVKRLD